MVKFRIISIIIPVYNEEVFVGSVVESVIEANTLGLEREIIVVDDGSSDGTAQILKEIESKYAEVTVLSLSSNQGKGVAVKRGILSSRGDVLLIQDADLEYRVADYPRLLEPILDDRADVVYGSRFVSQEAHRVLYFWHRVANGWLTLLSNSLTGLNLTDLETGYKVFRGELIRKVARKLEAKRFGFEPEVTARLARIKGIRFYEVGIAYYGRTYEEGKKIRWTDGVKAVGEIIKYNLLVK